jgi:hypothetical protein
MPPPSGPFSAKRSCCHPSLELLESHSPASCLFGPATGPFDWAGAFLPDFSHGEASASVSEARLIAHPGGQPETLLVQQVVAPRVPLSSPPARQAAQGGQHRQHNGPDGAADKPPGFLDRAGASPPRERSPSAAGGTEIAPRPDGPSGASPGTSQRVAQDGGAGPAALSGPGSRVVAGAGVGAGGADRGQDSGRPARRRRPPRRNDDNAGGPGRRC